MFCVLPLEPACAVCHMKEPPAPVPVPADPLNVVLTPAVLLVPATTDCTWIVWATGDAASAAPNRNAAAPARVKIRSVDQSSCDDDPRVRFVPSVVTPDAPANAPALLYWT